MRALTAVEMRKVAGGDDGDIAIGAYSYHGNSDVNINDFLNMSDFASIGVSGGGGAGGASGSAGGGSITITKSDGSSLTLSCPAGTIPIAAQGTSNTSGDASLIKSILTGIGFNVSGSFQAGGCKPVHGQNATSGDN